MSHKNNMSHCTLYTTLCHLCLWRRVSDHGCHKQFNQVNLTHLVKYIYIYIYIYICRHVHARMCFIVIVDPIMQIEIILELFTKANNLHIMHFCREQIVRNLPVTDQVHLRNVVMTTLCYIYCILSYCRPMS